MVERVVYVDRRFPADPSAIHTAFSSNRLFVSHEIDPSLSNSRRTVDRTLAPPPGLLCRRLHLARRLDRIRRYLRLYHHAEHPAGTGG